MKTGIRAAAASLAAAGTMALAGVTPASAATIENTNSDARLTLSFFQLGQSFTAADEDLLSIGFLMSVPNAANANADFTIKLFEGEGMGGTLLATRNGTAPFDLPAGFGDAEFVDFDFSGVSLTLGQQYTALVTSTSTRLGVSVDRADSYASGQAYLGGRLDLLGPAYDHCLTGGCDTGFRVTGYTDTGAVPEPATWALMIGGFGLAGAALRKSKAVAKAI